MGWFPPPPDCLPAKLSSVWAAAGLTHWHWPPGGEAERCDVPNDCLMFHDNSIGLVPELSIRISFTFSSRSFGDTLFLVFGSATAASGCGTRHFQPIAPPPAAALPAQLIWWTAALLPAALLPSQFHAPSVVCCLMLLCVSVRSGTGPSARQSPPEPASKPRTHPNPTTLFYSLGRVLGTRESLVPVPNRPVLSHSFPQHHRRHHPPGPSPSATTHISSESQPDTTQTWTL